MSNIESVKDQRYHEAAARIMSQDGYTVDFHLDAEYSFAEYRVPGPEMRIAGGHSGRFKIERETGVYETQFIGLDFVITYRAGCEARAAAMMQRVAEELGYACHFDLGDARFSKYNVVTGDEDYNDLHALKENWFFFIPKDVE